MSTKTKAQFRRPGSWLTTTLLLACSACTGMVVPDGSTGGGTSPKGGPTGIGTGTGTGTGAGGGSATGTGTGSATGTGTGTVGGAGTLPAPGGLWPATASTTLDAGRVTLRHLNNSEYDNTVHDLLGTMASTSQTYMFPASETNELFETNGQTLSYSSLLFSQVAAAAQGLVAELLARPANDPVRTKLIPCVPTLATFTTCMTQNLTPFMTSAYRRPVTPAEVTEVVTVGNTIAQAHSDPMPGLSGAYEAVLLAPKFLFRLEQSQNVASSTPTKLNDYELATRLSYFLGSTTPDAPLMQAAAAGQLASGGATYSAQVDRLLAAPGRLPAFVQDFAQHWLSLSDTTLVAPNDAMFGAVYSDALRLASPMETSAFFQSLIADAQPLPTLLTANFTFVNAALAAHYGIPAPGGTGFSKVTLPPSSNRMGLLTQETFLTVFAQPDRTSPVKRGVWVLDNLLCDGTAAPPPGVPALPALGTGTQRQVLATHRANPFCGSCHSLIDPIGLALENFDAIGTYRTLESGATIDASSTMTDGTTVVGAAGLANYLAKDKRLPWCLTKQVMTFAVGRTFLSADARAYVMGVANSMTSPTWVDLLKAVANSQAFVTTRGESS